MKNDWEYVEKTVRDYRRQKYFHVKRRIISLLLLNSPFSSFPPQYPKLKRYHLLLLIFSSLQNLPPPSISPLFSSYSPACLAELAAVWPKSPATGTTLEGAEPSTSRFPPGCVCLCARLCFFLFLCACVRERVRSAARLHTCLLIRVWPCQHDLDWTGW